MSEHMSAAEAAGLGDTIDDTVWLVGSKPRWCDICLKPSVRSVVRDRHHITVEGGSMGRSLSRYCFDHDGFVQ
jgi:hypothetical protein